MLSHALATSFQTKKKVSPIFRKISMTTLPLICTIAIKIVFFSNLTIHETRCFKFFLVRSLQGKLFEGSNSAANVLSVGIAELA